MDHTLSHAKNPLMGWDIAAFSKADMGEKISRAEIIVNGFSRYDKTFDSPLNQWQHQLQQQGQYPGDNVTRLKITDDKGNVTEAEDSWS